MIAIRPSSVRLTAAALALGLGLALLAPVASASAADHPIAVGGDETPNTVRGVWDVFTVHNSAVELTLEFPIETAGFHYPKLTWFLGGGNMTQVTGIVTNYSGDSLTISVPANFFASVPPIDSGSNDYYSFGVYGGDYQQIDFQTRLAPTGTSGVTHETYALTEANASTEPSVGGVGLAVWYSYAANPDRVQVHWGDTITLTGAPNFFTAGPGDWAAAHLAVILYPGNTSESVVPPYLTPTVSNGNGTVTVTLPSSAPGGGADWSSGVYLQTILIGDGADAGSSYESHLDLSFSPTYRIAGNSRFATSAFIAQEFDEADTVYIASGRNYPDALSAAPAAAHENGPLLLVDTDALPSEIAGELVRLQPSKVVIAGGFGTVSAGVEDAVHDLLPSATVIRHAGVDRYDTSRLITENAWVEGAAPSVFIATGANFPDALTASAAAAENAFDGPVILVPGGNSHIDAPTNALLQYLGAQHTVIAGSAASVSEGIFDSLEELGYTQLRFGGSDRYETGAVINENIFGASEFAYIATGLGYADALSGAALAGAHNAPLFVVPGTCIPQRVLDAIDEMGATEIFLFGGTTTLTTAVANLTAC